MDATRDNRRKRTFFGKREDETALIFSPPEEEGEEEEGETTVATALPPLSPFPPTPREFHVSVRTAERGGCSNYRRGREGAKANIGVAVAVVAFGGHIKAILS